MKIGQVINQAPALGLEHDKIRTLWVLDILKENMLETI
jgi:hypothetical protein